MPDPKAKGPPMLPLIDDAHHPDHPRGVRKSAEGIADVISSVLPPGWGFCLFTFEFGAGKTMGWISNSERQSMLDAIEEFLEKEGRPRPKRGQ